MIHARIRKQGNSMVVTIPKDAMERYELKEGDEIGFLPTRAETRYMLRPDVQTALDRMLENDQDVLEYLADR